VKRYIGFTPYLESNLWEGNLFELLYWDKGWQSGGVKDGNDSFLTFSNIPMGTIYLLNNKSYNKSNPPERPFLYQRNEVLGK